MIYWQLNNILRNFITVSRSTNKHQEDSFKNVQLNYFTVKDISLSATTAAVYFFNTNNFAELQALPVLEFSFSALSL